MTRSRVIVIGLHGGGPYYMEPLFEKGRLPTWRRLADQGLTARTRSTWPVAACSWVTLLTGLDVAEHGIVDTCEFDARRFPSLSSRPVDSSSYARQTWLALASDAGRRVAALSVPMTVPPWPINGVLVPGVPVQDEVHPPTWPPDFGRSLGPLSVGRSDEVDVRNIDACRRYLDFDLDSMVDAGRRVYGQEAWDLFVLVFKVPDLANHLFCGNPAADDDRALIDEYFERTDRGLGAFLETTDPESVLMVLSDHGSGPMPRRIFRAATWLEREGWLTRKLYRVAGSSVLDWSRDAYRAARASGLAQRVRRHLPEALVAPVRAIGHHWSFVDLGRTRVYPVDLFFPLVGFEVNLVGRQPEGTIRASQFEAVRQELLAELRTLKHPDSDAPLFRGVYLREQLFRGPHVDRLPDVVAELDHDFEATLQFGNEVFAPNPGHAWYPHRGYHTREGLLSMRGPGIPAGVTAADVDILDVMPTVLRLLGVPVPGNRRGRFIPDLVTAHA